MVKENINEMMVENIKVNEQMAVWKAKVNFTLVMEENILEVLNRIKEKDMESFILLMEGLNSILLFLIK